MMTSQTYSLDILSAHQGFSFKITEAAYEHLKKLIEKEPKGSFLRIQVETGGCSGFQYSFQIDSVKNQEDVLFAKERVYLVIDEASLRLLNQSTLDYEEDMMNAAFVIKNPNAKASCGCGNSFSMV